MITPTLRQLDIFAQMIASGAVADCARDLGLSPGEVEQEIDALETRLGHRLFDRKGGVATLTEAGRKTVEAMQHLSEITPDDWQDSGVPEQEPEPAPERQRAPMPAAAQDAPAHPSTFRPLSPKPLSMPHVDRPAIAPALAPAPAPAPLPAMAQREAIVIAAHPAIFSHFQDALSAFELTNAQDVVITLDLDTHSATQAIPALARGQIDIAYFYTLGEPEGWPTRYAWSEQMMLYIGADHPLADRDIVDHDDLAGVQPVMLSPGNSLRPLIDGALDMAGIARADAVLEADNLYDIMMAVRAGEGYFAGFGPLARDFARMNGIKRLPLAFPLPPIDVRQATRAAVRDDSMLAVFSEYLFR